MGCSKNLAQEFENSSKLITDCGKTFDNDILLKLYGYYKQASLGDCNTECPSFWNIKDKAKWEAWNQHKGMKKDHSMKRYIKLVSELLE